MKKLTATAALASILVLGLVGLSAIVYWRFEYREAIENWNIRLTSLADDREVAIESWLRDRWGDGQWVAGFPSVSSLLDDRVSSTVEEEKHLSGILAAMVANYGYQGAYILNGRGEPVVTSPDAPPLSSDCVKAAHQMTSDQSLRAFAFRGARTGEVRLGFLVRVGTAAAPPETAPEGWVLLVMDPARWLFPLLSREPVPTKSGEAVLLYQEGGDLVHITPLKFRKAAPLSVRVPLDRKGLAGREALLGHRLMGEFVDYRGVAILAATRPVAKTGWGMVVKVDRAEALAPFYRSMALQAVTLSGILCTLFGIAYGLWRGQRARALQSVLEERKRSEGRIIQLNLLLRTVTEIDQLVVRERDRKELLTEACRILVDGGPFLMAWVGSKEPDGRVLPIAQSKSSDKYLEGATVRWDDMSEGHGPTGTAIREKRAVMNPDTSLNPDVTPWRAAVLRAGYLASAAIPLRVRGKVVAALTVYCRESDAIGDEEQALLVELGNDLGYALEAIQEREEHRRAEEALRQSEERYRLIVSNTSDGIFTMDLEGRIRFVSPQWLKKAGYTEAEVIGRPTIDFVPKEYRALVGENFTRALNGVEIPDYEIEFLMSDGTCRPFEISMSNLLDATGEVSGRIGIFRDITERKRAEEALAESERFTRATLDALTAHICVLDAAGKIVAVNEAWRKFAQANGLGLLDAAVGANYLEVCDAVTGPEAEMAADAAAGIRAVMTSERARYLMEYPCHSPEKERWFTLRVTRSSGVSPALVVVAHENITQRQLAQQALIDSEAKYRGLYQEMLDGFVLVDLNGRILECNDAYCAMTGYSREELGDRTYMDLTPERWHDMERRIVDEQIMGDGYSRLYEKEYRRKDGTLVPIELRSYLERDKDGNPAAIWAIVRDVTERKRAEDALRASERRFALFMQNLPGVAVIRDLEGRYEYMNEAWEQAMGMRREDYIGKSPFETFPQKDAQRLVEDDRRLIEIGEDQVNEIELHHSSGPRWWLVNRFALEDDEGRPAHVAALYVDITDRKGAERALRDSEARLRTLVQTIPDLIWLKDPGGVYLSCNRMFERFFGSRVEDIVGKSDYDFVSRELADSFRENDRKAMAAGRSTSNEEWITFADSGEGAWLETIKTPMVDSTGTLIGVLGIGRDITERKQGEVALAASEHRFRSVMETVSLIGVMLDLEGKIILCNDYLLELTGWSREEVLHKSWFEFFLPEDIRREIHEEVFPKIVRSGEISPHHQNPILTKAGERRLVNWSNTILRDEGGDVYGVASFGEDITERKQAEAALSASEERFRRVTSSIADVAYSCSMGPEAEYAIDWVTGPAKAVLGYSTDELKAMGCWGQLVLEEDQHIFEKHVTGLAPGEIGACELRLRRRDGGIVWVSSYAQCLGKESGPEFTRLYGALVDITERKLAEAEILRLNAELKVHIQQRTNELVATTAELDGFSYSVSHDLRAPLRSIDGWSLALLEDYGEKLDDTARSYIETVRAETKHMGQLVDGLLQISRATRREMTRETLDLAEIARTVSMAVAREAPERQVTFVIPEEVMVEGDTTLMRLALQNLLKNAFKFTRTREHAVIEFGVTDQGGVPTYFVRDNGVGFDPQFSHKLFQPFQRLHLKEEYPGSAIGLATVQRIIHRHGGRVWAEGEVEKGATFFFTLGGGESEK